MEEKDCPRRLGARRSALVHEVDLERLAERLRDERGELRELVDAVVFSWSVVKMVAAAVTEGTRVYRSSCLRLQGAWQSAYIAT